MFACNTGISVNLKTNKANSHYMSHVTKKPCLQAVDEWRFTPACSAAETSQGLGISDAQADLRLCCLPRRLICAFVVRIWHKQVFSWCGSYYNWTASSEFGTYRLCEQWRFRRACASAQSRQNLRCSSAQSRQNLRCSLIQAVSQEEPSDRKPDPWPLWMAGHAQLKFVMTECSKTQIRLTGFNWTCCPIARLYSALSVQQ